MTDTRQGKYSIWAITKRTKTRKRICCDTSPRKWLCCICKRSPEPRQRLQLCACIAVCERSVSGAIWGNRDVPKISAMILLSFLLTLHELLSRHLSFTSSQTKPHLASFLLLRCLREPEGQHEVQTQDQALATLCL